ncbi:hypothetical protein C4568_04875 [Candidatus Parcubacteria bacterium]|nr:MAG: hypothetical protein C4568_04875 [Candidatus Parcubacteria bacterium]
MKGELKSRKSTLSDHSEEWLKLHWMLETTEYLSFAVDSLDEIGNIYRSLYKLPNEEFHKSQDFVYKKYREIVYHTRSFYESTYIYCSGLHSSDISLVSSEEFFSEAYSELVFVFRLRNLFIVHPTKMARTFREAVRVYALPDGEMFLPSISSNHLYSDETRRKYFFSANSHDEFVAQRDTFLSMLRQKIIQTGKGDGWQRLMSQLSAEEFERMQMLGAPDVNQSEYARELKALHELALSRVARS